MCERGNGSSKRRSLHRKQPGSRPKHISFSSIKDAQECKYRFKLKVIDGIRHYPASVDTIFGTLMHNSIQDYLLGRRTLKDSKIYFLRRWKKFYGLYKRFLDGPQVATLLKAAMNILNSVPEAFKGCEILTVEEKLEMPVSDQWPDINFLGFIDLVMFRGDQLIIADLKTAKSAWSFSKYLDDVKSYQLTYYKTYYARKHDIDLDDIEVCFIALEKTPTSKCPIQFIPDTSGERKIDKSQKLLHETLDLLNAEDHPKNLDACYNPKTGIKCPYYETQWCPGA